MSQFEFEETDQFLKDAEEAAVWILLNSIEQSVSFAEAKANQLKEWTEKLGGGA